MRFAIFAIVTVFGVSLVAAPPATNPQQSCEKNLKRLAAGLKAYRAVHGGQSPQKISDLYYEGFVEHLEDFSCPGSGTVIANRTELDDKSDFTLSPLPGADGMLVREKSPHQDGTVLAIFADGSTRAVPAGGPVARAGPATTQAVQPPTVVAIDHGPATTQAAQPPTVTVVKPPTTQDGEPPVVFTMPPTTRGGPPVVITLPPTTQGGRPRIVITMGREPPTTQELPPVVIVNRPPATRPGPPVLPPIVQPPVTVDPPELAAGEALYKEGKTKEAIEQFTRALERAPRHPKALSMRGAALIWSNDLKGSLADFTLLAQTQGDVESRRLRATMEMVAGDPRIARSEAEALLKANPADASIVLLHAQACLWNGDEAAAATSFARTIQLDPNSAAGLYQQANQLLAAGVYLVANMQYTTVLRLDPKMTGAYWGLGFANSRMGLNDRAIQAFAAYLQLDQTSPQAQSARQEMERLQRLAGR